MPDLSQMTDDELIQGFASLMGGTPVGGGQQGPQAVESMVSSFPRNPRITYSPKTADSIPLAVTGQTVGGLKSELDPIEKDISTAGIDIGKAVETDVQTQVAQAETSFGKIANLMGRTVSQYMGKLSEQGGGGILKGAKGVAMSAIKRPGYEITGAYSGQKFETALALNSLLTGQNRVIEGVLQKIMTTLPDDFETESYMVQKVAQSLYNSYALWKAMQRAKLTKEYFDQWTDEELEDLDSEPNQRISNLNVVPLTQEEIKAFEPFVQKVIDSPQAKKWKRME